MSLDGLLDRGHVCLLVVADRARPAPGAALQRPTLDALGVEVGLEVLQGQGVVEDLQVVGGRVGERLGSWRVAATRVDPAPIRAAILMKFAAAVLFGELDHRVTVERHDLLLGLTPRLVFISHGGFFSLI